MEIIVNLESRIEELENKLRVAKWDCERLKNFIKYLKKEEGIFVPKDIEMLLHETFSKKGV